MRSNLKLRKQLKICEVTATECTVTVPILYSYCQLMSLVSNMLARGYFC